MKILNGLVLISVSAILGATQVGCNSTDCGDGTHEVDGVCVAGGGCAAGTKEVNGECVPDGSVICGDGTAYDDTSGTCIPSDSVCAEGTVLVDGECVPNDSTLTADADEGPEPNGLNAGDGPAGIIPVPDIGGDGYVIHGCVNPFEDVNGDGEMDADFDAWYLQVDGPTLLQVDSDGVGGLAAGFVVLPGDEALANAGWQRYGLNLTSDTSSREVFLPKAGVYALAMTDSRSLFLGSAGNPDACYYTTITQVAMPAATDLPADGITDTIGSDIQIYNLPAPADADILDALMTSPSSSISPSLVFLDNGSYSQLPRSPPGSSATTRPKSSRARWIRPTATRWWPTLSTTTRSRRSCSTLSTTNIPAQAAPTGGSTVTFPSPSTTFNTYADLSWMYFDSAADGNLTNFAMTMASSDTISVGIFNDDMQLLTELDGVNAYSTWDRLPIAGRYYVAVLDTNGDAQLDVTGDHTDVTPAPITLGTPVSGTMSDLGQDWYTADLSTAIWVALTGTNLNLDMYDPSTSFGEVDADFGPFSSVALTAANVIGHIAMGEDLQVLGKVTGPSPGANYTLNVDNRDFSDLDTVTDDAPINMAGQNVPAAGEGLYLVRAAPGATVTVTATPAAWRRCGAQTCSIATRTPPTPRPVALPTWPRPCRPARSGFLAFRVTGQGGGAATYDVDVSSSTPKNYVINNGTMAYTDACAGGTTVPISDPDEGLSAAIDLPFAFSLYNTAATQVVVSSNGWATFDGSYAGSPVFSNPSIPNGAQPNNVIAPYWDDLDQIVVCTSSTADTFTIQWEGVRYSTTTTVKAQAVLHADGSIDYIYGDHDADGSSATVGVEDSSGFFGQQINGAGAAGTSQTFTPPAP